MTLPEKYDRILTGIIAAIVLPLIIGFFIFLFSHGNSSLHSFLTRLELSDTVTHMITLCVFPNVFIFLIFNRFDMLLASRGVLAVTIVWAIIVFVVKFSG